eukprot:487315_1
MQHAMILLLNQLMFVLGYLEQTEINALNDLYNSWNGKHWTQCHWDMVMINNSERIRDHCGLHFSEYGLNDVHSVAYNHSDLQYVKQIHFDFSNNLSGTIHSSIRQLSHLKVFDIKYNEFLTGTLPKQMCELQYLETFALATNSQLNDYIPSCLFDLPKLETFVLLDAPNLSLESKNIKQFCDGQHNHLRKLHISSVDYYGSIPECIGYNMTNLIDLSFHDIGNLNGTIPESINNLIHLEYIHLFNLPGIY